MDSYNTMHLAHDKPPLDFDILKRLSTPKNVFIITGITLLTLLCIVPVWNAIELMNDVNYVFWVGRSIPAWMVALCTAIIVVYTMTMSVFFHRAKAQVQNEQTIMMIANIFITLLGLVLMLLSLPLARQANDTYNNLMHKCDWSEQTHRMYEYSQVLHTIRASPQCTGKLTVEECSGYEAGPPYTNFLKWMEGNFRCTGFCYRPPSETALASADTETAAAAMINQTATPRASSNGTFLAHREHKDHTVIPLGLLQAKSEKRQEQMPVQTNQYLPKLAMMTASYPQTLFSDANYQASCEGMAARDMKNFAGDISLQTFYQGIYLVLIAITTGFLKLIGFCVRDDQKMP